MVGRWLFTLTLAGCSVSRGIAPLEPGQGAVTASFGGPFVEFGGAPIPLPVTSVGYMHGVGHGVTVHGALYPTQLALFGVAGLDLGASYEVFAPKGARPRLMLDLTLYSFFGDNQPDGAPGGFRLFPDLAVLASWDLGRPRHHLYVGVDNFVQPFPSFRYHPVPLLGAELKASPAVGILTEVKWMGLETNTLPLQPVWYGPGNQGAIAVQLGVNVYFDTRKGGSEP